jgi:hypothetical protein
MMAQQQMTVQCPPTSNAGDMIQVNVNGQMMTVQVCEQPSLATPFPWVAACNHRSPVR